MTEREKVARRCKRRVRRYLEQRMTFTVSDRHGNRVPCIPSVKFRGDDGNTLEVVVDGYPKCGTVEMRRDDGNILFFQGAGLLIDDGFKTKYLSRRLAE